MKDIYYYVFYSFYKFWESVSYPKIWSDFKAGITISALELFFTYSILLYYRIFFAKEPNFGKGKAFLIIVHILVFAVNAYIFVYSDKWKEAFSKFDKLPSAENEHRHIKVWFVAAAVIVNFIIACNIPHQPGH